MPAEELEAGHLVDDRHRVDVVLGRGAFATVYGGTDTLSGRRVAIKVLDPGSDDDVRTRARFERELRVVGQLRDPHTVKLFAYGTDGGRPFLVFEHLEGEDLSATLEDSGSLPPEVVEHVLRQLLASLREAHGAGLVHRDVKPENIRVFEYQGDPWCVKLLDFGLGRRFAAEPSQITAKGELVGTPRYMSPEQLLGEELTAASDLYSLGLVGFEMLMGRAALQGNLWRDQIARLESGHLFAAAGFDRTSNLQRVIEKMTSRGRDSRFQSAEAVLAALDHSDPEPSPAQLPDLTPPESSSESATATSRHRLTAAAVVVAVLAVVGLVSALASSERDAPQVGAQRRAATVPSIVRTSQPRPEAATPDLPTLSDRATGCGRTPPFTGRGSLFVVDGLTETRWLTYVPKRYEPEHEVPLVMLLHQGVESPEALLAASGFEDVAELNGFVLISPEDHANQPWRDVEKHIDGLTRIAAETKRQLCIDDARVFIVGHSQGGHMAEHLSCQPWVHGVATHSHRGRDVGSRCASRRVPFIVLSPRHSGHIPFDGGDAAGCGSGIKASVKDVEEAWQTRNGCTGPRRRGFSFKNSQCWEWTCETPLQSCHLEGGHGWPGSEPRFLSMRAGCDGVPADFPSAVRIWEFFAAIDEDAAE